CCSEYRSSGGSLIEALATILQPMLDGLIATSVGRLRFTPGVIHLSNSRRRTAALPRTHFLIDSHSRNASAEAPFRRISMDTAEGIICTRYAALYSRIGLFRSLLLSVSSNP